MTCPIDAWNTRYSLERTRLPADIEVLEVICCESGVRTISHIGIEAENCVFNSPALQQLRQRLAPGAKMTVHIRYNTELMKRIWVEDPVTHERFEVLNQDPLTMDLSAAQVAHIKSVQRKSESEGQVITRAQARKRIEAIYQPLLIAKTVRERRRALKILGVAAPDQVPQQKPKKVIKKSASKNSKIRNEKIEKKAAETPDVQHFQSNESEQAPTKYRVIRSTSNTQQKGHQDQGGIQ
jgi:hypothetical protein